MGRNSTANSTKQLVQTLYSLTASMDQNNTNLLRDLEKCPSSKTACALLVSALSLSQSAGDRDEMLTAYPGWIHPFV